MDREKGFKKKTINNTITNKMSDINNNKMIKLVQFPFNSIGDPFKKTWEPIDVSKDKLQILLKESKEKQMCFFENLITDGKIKPFYDVDVFLPNLDNQPRHSDEIKKYISSVQSQAVDFLKKYYPDGDIAISSSHGDKKKNIKLKESKCLLLDMPCHFIWLSMNMRQPFKILKSLIKKIKCTMSHL